MTHKRFVVVFAYGTALRWMKELERDFMIFFYKKTLPQNDKTSNVQPLMNFAKKMFLGGENHYFRGHSVSAP